MAARGVVALVFAKTYGFEAICFANPAAWIAACVLLIPACAVTGQAAGTAAALTDDFPALPVRELQERLRKDGVRPKLQDIGE